MDPRRTSRRTALIAGFLCCWTLFVAAADQPSGGAGNEIMIFEAGEDVKVLTPGAADWVLTKPGQALKPGFRVRTGRNSRLTLKWSDNSVMRFRPLTEIEILPPHAPDAEPGLHLFRGFLSFFHRDAPGRVRVITRAAAAGIRGTEFAMAVDAQTERATVWVMDGGVELTNNAGPPLVLTNGQAGMADVGQAPRRAPGFITEKILQWCFYYPGVIDLREVPFSAEEQDALSESLKAYRGGDLLAALKSYTDGTQPASTARKIYHAAILLSVGEVEQTETLLADLGGNADRRIEQLAGALRNLIAAVKRETISLSEPKLTSELLAASYYEQSRGIKEESLKSALRLARAATTNSPESGFAWVRVAELEFSFGRTGAALEALEEGLALSPRNAQALALKGFLLAARNLPREAVTFFDRAIAIDAALGNAWLGRGLCRIRGGDLPGGREDLLVAAALEPRRAALRSYLGKAYAESNDPGRALHELELAKEIDANDPTAWLYSALVKAENNRINEGIRDLEKSQELNDNRRLYRSQFLLDQDKAVRSVNLARLYADSDLNDVAVHEAGRAVTTDYADYSAHAFLANSYEVERRANFSNLRFEAASFGEYLLANLLGPANGQLLAQPVTQLEYSTLFERNRIGVIANTEYFGRGAWHHSSAQYGTYDGTSYSLEAEYRSEPAVRRNQDLEIRQLEAKFKHDITPDDSVYFHVIDYHANGGDIAQHFDERNVSKTLRFNEEQTPTILSGYHHEWSPQNHTLVLLGRVEDTLEASDPGSNVRALDRFLGTVTDLAPVTARDIRRSRVEAYNVEAQQIAVVDRHSLIAGARLQWSKQSIAERVQDPNGDFYLLLGTNNPVSSQREDVWSSSASLYAYDYIRVFDALQLVGGLNYTHQSLPANTTIAPVSSDRDHQERVSPKAAIIWSPSSFSILRINYTKSLVGSGLGQSVRLEPTQVGGLLQTFRTPVSPSLVGDLDGADLETSELLWEGRFDKTYLSLGGQLLSAERNRRPGLFLSPTNELYQGPASFGRIQERIRFREHALDFSVHQLVSEEWSFGFRYRLGRAQFKQDFPEYPKLGVSLNDQVDWQGWLHTVNLSGLYRHQSGVFGRAESAFFAQDGERAGISFHGRQRAATWDDFWQINLLAGYRFPRQKAEIAVGLLNVLDTDYRLDPINQHAEQPRSRTFYARLLLNF